MPDFCPRAPRASRIVRRRAPWCEPGPRNLSSLTADFFRGCARSGRGWVLSARDCGLWRRGKGTLKQRRRWPLVRAELWRGGRLDVVGCCGPSGASGRRWWNVSSREPFRGHMTNQHGSRRIRTLPSCPPMLGVRDAIPILIGRMHAPTHVLVVGGIARRPSPPDVRGGWTRPTGANPSSRTAGSTPAGPLAFPALIPSTLRQGAHRCSRRPSRTRCGRSL